jgi:putative isomerase
MSETIMSTSIILGSGEKFDLRSVPYSIRGSYLCILEDPEDRSLYLSITRSPTLSLERKNLIKMAPVLDNKEIPYEYSVEPGKLMIKTFKGTIELCFAEEKQIRIRGNGIGLRFYFKTIMFENASPKENGDLEVAYIILGKLLFVPLQGAMWNNAKWVPRKAMADDFMLELLPPVETGKYEAAIHEYYSNGIRDQEYTPFDDCVKAVEKKFEAFCQNYPRVPEKYTGMARLAEWTVWTHFMRPEGRLKNPVVYMSRLSLIRAFGWQQSYQAMAACRNVKEAWKLLLTMFDYQNEAGQIPDSVGEIGISYMVTKPALQGFALDYILSRCDVSELTRDDYAELYDKLSKFAHWWLTKRDRNGSGIPQYYHSDESGWDDATIFKKGLPLQSGDLLAYLVLLTEACGKLAMKLGSAGESDKWMDESKRLLAVLVNEFWNGRQFISRVVETGEIIVAGSIASLQPIILGKRLPQNIIDTIADRLANEEEYMTAGGIVSEILGSPEFTIKGGFMRGNIVAPVQLLLSMGLKNAGKEELARKIAARYCDLACEKGFSLILSPFEYDRATGLPMKKEDIYKPDDRNEKAERFKKEKKEVETVDQWTSWAAANFLTIAGYVLEE